jgi:D-tyrosyl-tRNA(Tyr) deacylase
MKIVLQRVTKAIVRVDNMITGSIEKGMLLFIGIHRDDTAAAADFLADKCAGLRIFPDEEGKMNLSVIDSGGSALVVSQFTLLGDCSKGRRPSFIDAAPPEKGNVLYNYFVGKLRQRITNVQTGIFGAMMQVELINDGPVTLLLEK